MLNYYFLDTTWFTYAENNFIRVTSLCDRRLTAPNFTAQMNQCCEKYVSISPMRRRLCEADLYGRIAIKKPQLRKQNNVKRLQWVKTRKDLTTEQWNKVLWTHESKLKIFQSNRGYYVRRRVGERAVTSCITSTVKFGGDSVFVWRAFANCKFGDLHLVKGKLNQIVYHSILQHTILSGTRLVAQRFVLMQDNDPKHASKLCYWGNKYKKESVDLNCCE